MPVMVDIRAPFRRRPTAPAVQPPSHTTPPARISSPFADRSTLETLVWGDILGTDNLPLSRASAMRVPALARARHLIAPTIARCPLVAYRGDTQTDTPPWTYRSYMHMSAYHRMLWTVDDLIFYGWSLWSLERRADGNVTRAGRIPAHWWKFADDGRILATLDPTRETTEVPADSVLLIPGTHEGLLTFGKDTIEQAASLAQTASDRARYPEALVELHYTGEYEMTQDDIDALLDDWMRARSKAGRRAVSYTPRNVETKTHGTADSGFLTEARNTAAVDIARIIGIPALMIDATAHTASLSYETTQGRNAEF